MTAARPGIPAQLERDLFLEAGYQCAVPMCGATDPLEIEHIIEWAAVKEHNFSNMIVLCANHHRRKGPGPRNLDRQALQQIKTNLALVNGRYGDVERRVIDFLVVNPDKETVPLPGRFEVLLMRLLSDGLIEPSHGDGDVKVGYGEGNEAFLALTYALTERGKTFIENLRSARSLG